MLLTVLPKVVSSITRFGGHLNGNEMLCAFGSVVDDSTLLPSLASPSEIDALSGSNFDLMARNYGNS